MRTTQRLGRGVRLRGCRSSPNFVEVRLAPKHAELRQTFGVFSPTTHEKRFLERFSHAEYFVGPPELRRTFAEHSLREHSPNIEHAFLEYCGDRRDLPVPRYRYYVCEKNKQKNKQSWANSNKLTAADAVTSKHSPTMSSHQEPLPSCMAIR